MTAGCRELLLSTDTFRLVRIFDIDDVCHQDRKSARSGGKARHAMSIIGATSTWLTVLTIIVLLVALITRGWRQPPISSRCRCRWDI